MYINLLHHLDLVYIKSNLRSLAHHETLFFQYLKAASGIFGPFLGFSATFSQEQVHLLQDYFLWHQTAVLQNLHRHLHRHHSTSEVKLLLKTTCTTINNLKRSVQWSLHPLRSASPPFRGGGQLQTCRTVLFHNFYSLSFCIFNNADARRALRLSNTVH